MSDQKKANLVGTIRLCIYVIPERSHTLHYQLVLLAFAVLHCHTSCHADLSDVLLTQEISHLYEGTSLRNGTIDWEVSIHCSHFVQVALGDSLEHVQNMATNSSHSSKLLLLAKPFLDFDGILVYHVDVNRQVLEGLGQRTPGTFYGYSAGLNCSINPFWHSH